MRGMRVQKYARNTSCFGSACITLRLLWKDARQELPEAREIFKCPLGMFDAMPVNLRSGHDGFAQVTLTAVGRDWHKQVVHSRGPRRGKRAKKGSRPCMHKGIPTAIAEGLHNALDRVGR